MKYAFFATAETRRRKTIDQVWCVCTCNQRYCRWKIRVSVKETIAMVHRHQQFVLVLRAWLFSRELRWKGSGKVALNVVVLSCPFKEIDVWSGDCFIGITLCVVFFLVEVSGGKFFFALAFITWICRRFSQKGVKIVLIIPSLWNVFVTCRCFASSASSQPLVTHYVNLSALCDSISLRTTKLNLFWTKLFFSWTNSIVHMLLRPVSVLLRIF